MAGNSCISFLERVLRVDGNMMTMSDEDALRAAESKIAARAKARVLLVEAIELLEGSHLNIAACHAQLAVDLVDQKTIHRSPD
jgi:hypothetical protein